MQTHEEYPFDLITGMAGRNPLHGEQSICKSNKAFNDSFPIRSGKRFNSESLILVLTNALTNLHLEIHLARVRKAINEINSIRNLTCTFSVRNPAQICVCRLVEDYS